MTTTTNYQQQAIDFLQSTGTTFSAKYVKSGKYFTGDTYERDIYKISLKRGNRSFNFEFGQSINNSGIYQTEPTAYDVIACLQKYNVGTFEDFCSEFGYDTDSKRAEKTYLAVKDEYMNVCKLFTDAEIEQLQDIN